MLSVSTKPETVRLSPAGGFVAGFYPGGLAWIATEGGKPSVKPVREEIRGFHDVAWLSEQRLLGLVTAKADRLQPGSEERLVVWNSTGEIVQTATHATAMDLLAVAPDGRRFAEAGADKSVRIRDAGTLAVLQEFRTHDGPITALAWHPQRPVLATASSDLTIRLWDLDTGRRLEEFTGPSRPAFDLVFSPSGHLLGCAAHDNPTRIWEPESLRDKVQPVPGKTSSPR
jgi:WD40 repeat protein